MEARPEGIFDEQSRRPTNKLWLIPFVIAVVAFIVLVILGSTLEGFDGVAMQEGEGKSCGFDSDVLDKPLRADIDERDCANKAKLNISCTSPYICLKECPKGSFDANSCNNNNYQELKVKLVCQSDKIYNKINNCDQLRNAVQHGDCLGWYDNMDDFLRNCMSHPTSRAGNDDVVITAMNLNIGEAVLSVIPSFLYAVVVAGVISFFFILTLKWSAAFVFWGFVGLIIVGLTSLMIAMVVGVTSGLLKFRTEDDGKIAMGFVVVLISIILLVLIICLYCFRKKIKIGIEIVKESSRCVVSSFGAILFPLLPFLLRAAVVIATVYTFLKAFTMVDNVYKVDGFSHGDCSCKTKTYFDGETCLPKEFNENCRASDGSVCTDMVCKLIEQTDSTIGLPFRIAIIMLSIWIVAFIQANAKMILAHVYGNWYWNWNQEFIPSGAVLTGMSVILSNHTGTAAFGGFVVMVCRMLKSLLSNRSGGNTDGIGAIIGRVIIEIFRTCAAVFLELVEFVSDKAFVVVAIMGTGFWDSVKTVSTIMCKDIPLVVATESVGDTILFVCKFVAAIASASLFYFTSPFKGDQVWITIILTIFFFVFAYDLASVLLAAYDIAIDTLLICTLQDYKHNNQTEKAYFKSQTLNELLIKKKEDA